MCQMLITMNLIKPINMSQIKFYISKLLCKFVLCFRQYTTPHNILQSKRANSAVFHRISLKSSLI